MEKASTQGHNFVAHAAYIHNIRTSTVIISANVLKR